jgi:hypothetical protein
MLQMLKPNLPLIRRRLLFKALSWTLGILEKPGLMKQPLETEFLIAAARRRARLDNFGDETFREPLRRLLDCCESEARLNTIGKLALTEDILQLLINRLQIQRDRHNWPRISKEAIVAPLFIVGLPRTGTTLLHGLLAQDHDAFSTPTTWEVMFPSPPPSLGQKGRIKRAKRRLGAFHLLAPEFQKIHPISAHLPQECIAIMSHTFMSDQFGAMYNIPAYESWLKRQDKRPVYQFHRQFLQHLQYGRPARRFVLKAPHHMLSIEALFATYPDALVVQTHLKNSSLPAKPFAMMRLLTSSIQIWSEIRSECFVKSTTGSDATFHMMSSFPSASIWRPIPLPSMADIRTTWPRLTWTRLIWASALGNGRAHEGCINRCGDPVVRYVLIEMTWRLVRWQRVGMIQLVTPT